VEVVGVADELGDDLTEAERDDGEVVAAEAQGRQADEDAAQRRNDRRAQEHEPDRDVDAARIVADPDRAEVELDLLELARGQPARGIGAERVEGDVAEIEQAAVAHDDVEPDRHHREDEDRHGRVHVGEGEDDRDVRRQAVHVERVGHCDRQEHREGDQAPRAGRQLIPGVAHSMEPRGARDLTAVLP
jgi:hypothetical protein